MSKPITKCINRNSKNDFTYADTDSVCCDSASTTVNKYDFMKDIKLKSGDIYDMYGSIYTSLKRTSHVPKSTDIDTYKAPLHPFKENHIGGFINMDINVHVHTKGCEPKELTCGDWIDLKSAEDYHLSKGEFALIDLGISMQLPDHMEAFLIARSSTFIKYKVIQTNAMGIIDNSYNGDADVWKLPVLAIEETTIPKGTRIAQFRIIANQPTVRMHFVDKLNNTDRGGFGSTGD